MTAKILTTVAAGLFALTSLAQTNSPNDHKVDSSGASSPPAMNGRSLFLKNCAHCHGATAHGDDGPDLHNLDFTADWIANRIRKGKAGQMTAFAGKLQPAEIDALTAYVQSLK